MNHTDPHGWAGAQAQLHDAAYAARQIADDTERAAPPPSSAAVPRPRAEAPLMPAEPDASQQPCHPVRALTTRQLGDYRRDLEHALKHLPAAALVRGLLRRHLAQVQADQDSRAQAASPPSMDPGQ